MKPEILSNVNLLSMGLAIPTIILASVVIYVWFPSAKKALFKRNRIDTDWFILGVCLGFVGVITHATYWFIFFISHYFSLDVTLLLKDWGNVVNVFARQSLLILSAYCHIKASSLSKSTSGRQANNLLVLCNVIGALAMILIFSIREAL